MLTVLGGLPGSDHKRFARELSASLGHHFHDINGKKPRRFMRNTEGNVRERIVHPSSDQMRIHVYTQVIEDFPRLSKMHPDTVVDGTFHRKAPRELFLSGAKRYFNTVLFVWLDADEQEAERRAQLLREKGQIKEAQHFRKLRERTAGEFEDFTGPILTFAINEHATPDMLGSFVRKHIR